MSKYTGMAFNQLRSEAKAAGFEGTNPKRADLEAFLESRESTPEVGAISLPASVKTVKNKVEVVTDTATSTEVSVKRKYSTVGKDAVKERRKVMLDSVKKVLPTKSGGQTQSEIFRSVCEDLKIELSNNAWTDLSNALSDLKTSGFLTVSKEDKKRSKYLVS